MVLLGGGGGGGWDGDEFCVVLRTRSRVLCESFLTMFARVERYITKTCLNIFEKYSFKYEDGMINFWFQTLFCASNSHKHSMDNIMRSNKKSGRKMKSHE